jgi:hypothetical protein
LTEKQEETPQEENKQQEVPNEVLATPLPPELEEALKGAPKEVRRAITQMGMFRVMGPMQPPAHPLFEKFTPQHIDKFLDYSHTDDENTYKLQSSNRIYHLGYFLLALLFLGFLVTYLAHDNAGLLSEILRIFVIFAGGFGSGFGVKSYLEKKK